MSSAAFSVNGGSSPQTTSAGATVTLALLNTSGVGNVEWSILGGSDSTQTPPVITPGGSPQGATATFVMNSGIDGSIGLSWIVQCRINSGVDTNGAPVGAYTATALVGVTGVLGILPFAAFERFERDPIVGIANDLNKALRQAAAGQTSATYVSPAGGLNITGAATTLIQQIPIGSNTAARIYLFLEARDTTNGVNFWDSFTKWSCLPGVSSGNAIQAGGDFGPAPPAGTIGAGLLTGAWVTVVGSGSNVNISVVTSSGSHCKFFWRIYVVTDAIPAAT